MVRMVPQVYRVKTDHRDLQVFQENRACAVLQDVRVADLRPQEADYQVHQGKMVYQERMERQVLLVRTVPQDYRDNEV